MVGSPKGGLNNSVTPGNWLKKPGLSGREIPGHGVQCCARLGTLGQSFFPPSYLVGTRFPGEFFPPSPVWGDLCQNWGVPGMGVGGPINIHNLRGLFDKGKTRG